MLLIAKVALGCATALAAGGAYTLREGVIRIDVDENQPDGSHIHFWVPATAVPVALKFMPQREMGKALEQTREYLPTIRAAMKGLEHHPDFELVDVSSPDEHVRVSAVGGRLQVDVSKPSQEVHVAVPIETLTDVIEELASRTDRHSDVEDPQDGA